jgi:hypothetical protein
MPLPFFNLFAAEGEGWSAMEMRVGDQDGIRCQAVLSCTCLRSDTRGSVLQSPPFPLLCLLLDQCTASPRRLLVPALVQRQRPL